MNGIQQLQAVFERRQAQGRKVLIPYITAGDPDPETTSAVLDSLVAGGADIIELGVPFSDPMADGPVIAAASVRALENGFSMDRILSIGRAFHERHPDVPIVLFGYYNPFFRYGHEALAREAAAAGIAGVLCVDCPPEEAGPLHNALTEHGLALIPLVTPTSDAGRLAKIGSIATAFAYYVSVTGVTGSALVGQEAIAERAGQVRDTLGLPLVVGFGVRTPEDARCVSQHVDGVVVGSALVQTLLDAAPTDRASKAQAFIGALRNAV